MQTKISQYKYHLEMGEGMEIVDEPRKQYCGSDSHIKERERGGRREEGEGLESQGRSSKTQIKWPERK